MVATIIDHIIPFSGYLPSREYPPVIAGPCSAESERQVLETARQLARLPEVAAFRCGLWKPRTRPGEFEGVGAEGLAWLRKAKQETGLAIAVEVALPQHIELCLKNEVDILWIGSRTVVNPFSVNEIASALKGVDVRVMVKNPVNPDLLLWIGALERLHQQGIRKLAAVHRGFSAYHCKPFRNLPQWEIPIELRRLVPDLPVLVDPSHISGNRAMLRPVIQKAADLAFDGLMIESHVDPANALTDGVQQVSPKELADLLARIEWPVNIANEVGREDAGENIRLSIVDLRLSIDEVDGEILRLLAERMELVKKIGARKKELGMDALQLERWTRLVEDRLEKGASLGLSRNFLLKLLHTIHEEALRIQ